MAVEFLPFKCSKCGRAMLVTAVESTATHHMVTYECTPCGTFETRSVPLPPKEK